MNLLENILIVAGISLDIFAAMEIEGAMLAVVKRKTLIIACALVALLQMIFYFGGLFCLLSSGKERYSGKGPGVGLYHFDYCFYGYRHQNCWSRGSKRS